MKKLQFSLSVALSLIFIVSCNVEKRVYTESYFNCFNGATTAQIIQYFGAPNRETSDGNGGKVLVYNEMTGVSNTAYYTPAQQVVGNLYLKPRTNGYQQINSRGVEFYVNQNNKVYMWKQHGYPYSWKILIKKKKYETMDKRPFQKPGK